MRLSRFARGVGSPEEWLMPRTIRQLKADLRRAGFRELPRRGKGNHSYWIHPEVSTAQPNLAGKDGANARPYQEREIRDASAQVERAQRGR